MEQHMNTHTPAATMRLESLYANAMAISAAETRRALHRRYGTQKAWKIHPSDKLPGDATIGVAIAMRDKGETFAQLRARGVDAKRAMPVLLNHGAVQRDGEKGAYRYRRGPAWADKMAEWGVQV